MKNNYKVYFLKSFLTFLGLLFAVGTYSIVNAAWNTYVNTGDTVTSTLWNDMIGRLVSHDTSITTLTTADSNNVKLTGNQTIGGTKTFSSNVVGQLGFTGYGNANVINANGTDHVYYTWYVGGTRRAYMGYPAAGSQNLTLMNEFSAKSLILNASGFTFNSGGSIGGNVNMTSLQINGGGTITGVSTDGTFSANSDAKLPTEKAIKTYIDSSFKKGQLIGNAAGLKDTSITDTTNYFSFSNDGTTKVDYASFASSVKAGAKFGPGLAVTGTYSGGTTISDFLTGTTLYGTSWILNHGEDRVCGRTNYISTQIDTKTYDLSGLGTNQYLSILLLCGNGVSASTGYTDKACRMTITNQIKGLNFGINQTPYYSDQVEQTCLSYSTSFSQTRQQGDGYIDGITIDQTTKDIIVGMGGQGLDNVGGCSSSWFGQTNAVGREPHEKIIYYKFTYATKTWSVLGNYIYNKRMCSCNTGYIINCTPTVPATVGTNLYHSSNCYSLKNSVLGTSCTAYPFTQDANMLKISNHNDQTVSTAKKVYLKIAP